MQGWDNRRQPHRKAGLAPRMTRIGYVGILLGFTRVRHSTRKPASAQEPRETIKTRIGLSIEAVVCQIPFAANREHVVANVIPITSGTRKRVPPTKLRHMFEAGAAVQLRHPRRDGASNDCQITPATELCPRSCNRHD